MRQQSLTLSELKEIERYEENERRITMEEDYGSDIGDLLDACDGEDQESLTYTDDEIMF